MRNKLFKNIGFLTLSQAANYVLPLITIPYITRVVGPDNYGLIEFGMVSMLYFSAIVIYGFNTTATRKIAENAHNINKVSQAFSAVMYTRMLLFLVATLFFVITLLLVPKFSEHLKLMLYAFPVVLGWAIYPDFLFQGLQKLQVIAVANVAIKLFATVFTFVLLQEPEDFYWVLGINSIAQIGVGVAAYFYAFYSVKELRLLPLKIKTILAYLQNGMYVFLSHFFTRIYTFGSIIFLGLLLTDKEVGLFAAGMKLITVSQSFLFLPLFGALFPYLTNLYKQDQVNYLRQFKKALWVMIGVSVFSSSVLMLMPAFFVRLVFGAEYLEVVPYLQIMAPILIASAVSHFSMQQGLIIFRKDKIYLYIIVATGCLSLVLNYFVIVEYRLLGAAWVKLGVDVFMAILGLIYFRRALQQSQEAA